MLGLCVIFSLETAVWTESVQGVRISLVFVLIRLLEWQQIVWQDIGLWRFLVVAITLLALTLMWLVSFLCGFWVCLGSQLNSARHKQCDVSNPQSRNVNVSTDEISLRIPDTQSPIADEVRQDNLDIKQSPEVADVAMSSVRSGNLEDSVSGIVLQDEVSQGKTDLSVPNRRTTVGEIVDSDCGAEAVVDTSAEVNADLIFGHKPKLKVPLQ